MKKLIAMIPVLVFGQISFACPFCNKQIRQGIFNSQFYPNLLSMFSAFIVLAVIVILLAILTTKRYRSSVAKRSSKNLFSPVPLSTTATILGIGFGGFIDGIVLHQILQFHEMLSNKIPPLDYVGKSINMFWDGIFHAFTFIVTFIGVILLWKLLRRTDIDRSGNLLAGGLLMGWGLFNLVEGIIDHQVLKLHNVKEIAVNKDVWNYGFLAFSVVLVIVGWIFLRSKKQHSY